MHLRHASFFTTKITTTFKVLVPVDPNNRWILRWHNYKLVYFFSYQTQQIQRGLVCPPYQWLDNGTKKGSSQLVVCVCTVPQKSVYDHQNHNKSSLKYNRLASWSICDIWNGEWFWHDTSKEGAYHLRCGYLLAFLFIFHELLLIFQLENREYKKAAACYVFKLCNEIYIFLMLATSQIKSGWWIFLKCCR